MLYENLRALILQLRFKYFWGKYRVKKYFAKRNKKYLEESPETGTNTSKRRKKKRRNAKIRKGHAPAAYIVESPPDFRIPKESTNSPEILRINPDQT